MVVDVGGEQQFVRRVALDEISHALGDLLSIAKHRAGQCTLYTRALMRLPEAVDIIDGRGNLARLAATQIDEAAAG